jgi:phosphatidylserine decarboxylase
MESLELTTTALALIAGATIGVVGYLFWRHYWFFRNPPRCTPAIDGVLSAADGTVVYVRKVEAGESVVHIKRGLSATLTDLIRTDEPAPKLVIGVFMSPFDVHYNRAPITGRVQFVRHHAGRGRNLHMGPMHWRILSGRPPYSKGSRHIVQNERTVTKIDGWLKGSALSCYVVQIAAKTVAGIDSYVNPGRIVERGQVFGMIRIGSQVDIVLPWRDDLNVHVQPGDRVRAGETVLCD